ncbi:hypothetical protein ACI798_01305 [Geodermatophilus sp. SYSU D01045]
MRSAALIALTGAALLALAGCNTEVSGVASAAGEASATATPRTTTAPQPVVRTPTPVELAEANLINHCNQYCDILAASDPLCRGGVNECLTVDDLAAALTNLRLGAADLVNLGETRFSAVVEAIDSAHDSLDDVRANGCDGIDWQLGGLPGSICQLIITTASLSAATVPLAIENTLR